MSSSGGLHCCCKSSASANLPVWQQQWPACGSRHVVSGLHCSSGGPCQLQMQPGTWYLGGIAGWVACMSYKCSLACGHLRFQALHSLCRCYPT